MSARRGGGRRRGERGGVALLVALSMFLIMGILLSALVVGRLVFKRREVQTAADAAVLALAHTVQQRGFPYSTNIATSYFKPNTDLTITTAQFGANHYFPTEYRRVVNLELNARMLTLQKWLPDQWVSFNISTQAQFNEQQFGDKWPLIYFVLDASKTMKSTIAGGYGKPAWDVLKEAFIKYTTLGLPARNGVLAFDKAVIAKVPPSTTSKTNVSAIKAAIGKILSGTLQAGTNTALALDTVSAYYKTVSYMGRNTVYMSDGMPTWAPGCSNPDGKCAAPKALQSATKLRKTSRANLLTVELRNSMTSADPNWSKQIVLMAGAAGSNGNDKSMNTLVVSKLGIQQFLDLMARTVCSWGPLTDKDYLSLSKAIRPFMNTKTLASYPRRIFAFLQYPGGTEIPLALVKNANDHKSKYAFEYYTTAAPYKVILSLKACQEMGKDPDVRLVIRWDQPQLAMPLP